MRYTRVVVVVLGLALAAGAQGSSGSSLTLQHFERLSFDVRGHRLRPAERDRIEVAVRAGGREAGALYSRLVDEWLDKDAFKRYLDTFLRFPNVGVTDATAETFFHRLERHGHDDSAVYFLPHTTDSGDAPCRDDERFRVTTWWQEEPISVCRDSYRPSVVFDEIGYCSGEAEPLMRQPPRAGCGCGPAMMGCLPPVGDRPSLDLLVETAAEDEWFETAARIVDEDRPLDELLTTSRTWQSGLAEFLYLRRQILGELNVTPWTPAKEAEILQRVSALDVYAPGRWVARSGVYEGSGIWWTSLAPHALKIPVRGVSHHLLARHLGSDFHAVNVDAGAVLRAVGRDDENLRTLSSITAAPMRHTRGCRGCHAPMDGVAGFLGELQGPMYGSFPTGQPAAGEFFVSGAEDFRGEGQGAAELGRFVVSQPEFETVSVRRAFEEVMLRPLTSRDQPLFEELVKEFQRNGHRWRPVIEGLLESEAYKNPDSPRAESPRPRTPGTMSDAIPAVVSTACVSCHDEYHDMLDLRKLPPADDVAAWTRIWSRVNDYSMPPPEFDGQVTGRFPLDPAVRRRFVAAIERMLGPALDRPTPPRHLDSRAWVSVVRDVAGADLSSEFLETLTAPLSERVVLRRQPRRGYVPALQLTLERISEEVCREVVASGSESYGFSTPVPSDDTRARSVKTLLTRAHGSSPTENELHEARSLLGRFDAVTGNPGESWVGLCSTTLTSPRLMFELYVRSEGGRS